MSDFLRRRAQKILSELNRSALNTALAKTRRSFTRWGAVLCVGACLFWAGAMLMWEASTATSFAFLCITFALAFGMVVLAACQLLLEEETSEAIGD